MFYSWLCDKSEDNVVDTYRSKMSEYFKDSKENIHNMLNRLLKLGFVEREVKGVGEYGKLKLLK